MIYFIQSGQRPFVKIGYCTGDPRRRLGRLQIGNPEELRLISTKDGGRTEELEWHGRFDHLRVRGEWFRFEDDLRDAARPLLVDDKADRVRAALALVSMPPSELGRRYEALFQPKRARTLFHSPKRMNDSV